MTKNGWLKLGEIVKVLLTHEKLEKGRITKWS